jgi:hypothetical protein
MHRYVTNENINWSVLIFNNVFPKNSREIEILKSLNGKGIPFISSDHFERLLRILRNTDYWIAPVSAAGKYLEERKNSTVNVNQQDNILIIKVTSKLDPYIYNHPLTVEISTNWEHIKVTNSMEDGLYNPRNGKIYINVIPGKEVMLEKL